MNQRRTGECHPPANSARWLILAAMLATYSALGLAADPATRPGVLRPPPAPQENKLNPMKIRLTINGKPTLATLDDNAAARDFLSLLPLSLTLKDYA